MVKHGPVGLVSLRGSVLAQCSWMWRPLFKAQLAPPKLGTHVTCHTTSDCSIEIDIEDKEP